MNINKLIAKLECIAAERPDANVLIGWEAESRYSYHEIKELDKGFVEMDTEPGSKPPLILLQGQALMWG